MNTVNSTGSGINLQGSATTAPLSAKGLLVITKVDMGTIHDLGTALGISLPVSHGLVEQLQTNFSLAQVAGQAPILALEPLNIQAKELKIEYHGQLLEVPVWQSEQGSFTPSDPVLHLGRVRLQQAKLTCRRQSADGSWHTLLTDDGGQAHPQLPMDLASLDLTNGSMLIENLGPPDISLRLERFDLQVDPLDKKQANNLSVAAMLDDKYPIQATGSFTLNPFTASLNIQATDLPLASFKPVLDRYFASPMTGALSANGTLSLPSLNYQGQWAVTSLASPPFSCRRMSGEGNAFTLRPLGLTIDRLSVESPALQITANDNGFPVLPAIMQPGWQPAPSADLATVRIKAMDLYDGKLTYDYPGPPGFTLSSQQIDGTISDLIVARDQSITFDLSGTMEDKGEFAVQGQITPFASQPGLTMTSRVDGLPLTALAPLLEPLWGFTIKAGTLDFASALTYEQTLIHDVSHLTFHDLVLGRPLAEQAIKAIGASWQSLPLTQALLQDAAGAVTCTVPIDGRTDAGFTYPQGMRNFLKQLLLKSSVSPVNLLSAEHQAVADSVEFEPGSDRLTAAAEGQLQALAALLKDRPLLGVSLSGLADTSADSKALMRAKKTAKGELAKGQALINDELLLALASLRAQTVHELLASLGVSPRQLRLAQPELISSSKAGRTGHRVAIALGVAG
jgi:outer membrane protein OmpA-like peptidoglycan-associated protein